MLRKILFFILSFFRTKVANKWLGSPIDSPSIPRVREVWLGGSNGRMITVESLTVEKYLQIIPRLEHIPSLIFKSFEYRDTPVEFLTAALDVAKEELLSIVEITSGLDRKFIAKHVTAPELVRFLKAVYEVNEFEFIAGEIRGLLKGVLKKVKTAPQDNHTDG